MTGFLQSESNTALAIQFFFAIASIISCFLTLIIISGMEGSNGYLLLIKYLTISQGFYDFSLILGVSSNGVSDSIAYFLRLTFGVSTTLFTNVISFVVLYVVFRLKSFEVRKKILPIVIVIYLCSIPFGILSDSNNQTTENQTILAYNYIRLASILVNCIFYISLVYKIRQMHLPGNDPLSILVIRLKYYPLIQVLTRIPATWYELEFGQGVTYNTSFSTAQKFLLLLDSVTKPSAGIGFFFVFLLLTPAAIPQAQKLYLLFLQKCCCCCSYLSCCKIPEDKEVDSISSYMHNPSENSPPSKNKADLISLDLNTPSGPSVDRADSRTTAGFTDFRASEMTVYEDMSEEQLEQEIHRLSQSGPTLSNLSNSLDSSPATGLAGFFQSFQTHFGQNSSTHYSAENYSARFSRVTSASSISENSVGGTQPPSPLSPQRIESPYLSTGLGSGISNPIIGYFRNSTSSQSTLSERKSEVSLTAINNQSSIPNFTSIQKVQR